MLRAIYITPKSKASIRSIDTGIYDVHLKLGTKLDLRQLRFQEDGFVPDAFGPFEFFCITTANGTVGQQYQVVVNPSAIPASNSIDAGR